MGIWTGVTLRCGDENGKLIVCEVGAHTHFMFCRNVARGLNNAGPQKWQHPHMVLSEFLSLAIG